MNDKSKSSATVSNAARAMAQKRWAKASKAKRRAQGQYGKLGGRPKSERRCFCGKVTMERAASRAFDCCRAAGVLTLNTARVIRERYA